MTTLLQLGVYEINHIRTVEIKSNEEWSSWTQFMQLRKEPEKIQDFEGIWTRDLGIS